MAKEKKIKQNKSIFRKNFDKKQKKTKTITGGP